jgi:hypothetical protein
MGHGFMNDYQVNDFLVSFYSGWKNRAHYIWGAGTEGQQMLRYFGDEIQIKGVIDSDTNKHGQTLCGHPILSFESVKQEKDPSILITSGAYQEISGLLISNGFKADIDFCDWKKLMGMHFWIQYEQLRLYRLDLTVTQRCTLSCQHCNMQRPAFKNPVDLDFPSMLRDLDSYFNYVDFLCELNILGGEPLLFKQLPDLLEYIGRNWGNKIGEIHIFTNGTIVPTPDIILLIKRFHIIMDISDYFHALPNITTLVLQTEKTLKENDISYRFKHTDQWLDFGFPSTFHSDNNDLQAIFADCHMAWRGIYNQKYYFCNLEINAEQLGQFIGDSNDWFDLDSNDPVRRENLLKLDIGYPNLGYLTYCRHCDGCGLSNKKFVPAAKQISNKVNVHL